MIKFCGSDRESGKPMLGIGLSRENCERLLAGEPILFETVGMEGLPHLFVSIIGGETDGAMAVTLVNAGAKLGPDLLKVETDSRLNNPHVHPVDPKKGVN